MDEQQEKIEETTPEVEETPVYIPRPAWQIWLARLCLVLFWVLSSYTISTWREVTDENSWY